MSDERFKIVMYHGEYGTAYYAIDTMAPEDEHPAIVASWIVGTHNQKTWQNHVKEADE